MAVKPRLHNYKDNTAMQHGVLFPTVVDYQQALWQVPVADVQATFWQVPGVEDSWLSYNTPLKIWARVKVRPHHQPLPISLNTVFPTRELFDPLPLQLTMTCSSVNGP
jgi:hypothetical protein